MRRATERNRRQLHRNAHVEWRMRRMSHIWLRLESYIDAVAFRPQRDGRRILSAGQVSAPNSGSHED